MEERALQLKPEPGGCCLENTQAPSLCVGKWAQKTHPCYSQPDQDLGHHLSASGTWPHALPHPRSAPSAAATPRAVHRMMLFCGQVPSSALPEEELITGAPTHSAPAPDASSPHQRGPPESLSNLELEHSGACTAQGTNVDHCF